MRLHRVRVHDFRGIADCQVAFNDGGVTVVEGPNEIGKTSILDAVHLLFEYPDSSKAGAVKGARPVDRDAGPQVEVEASTGPYRFTYRKRWLSGPFTELSLIAPANEQLGGRDAHDRVEAILDQTLDHVLWTALWLRQGDKLTQAGFSDSLGRALDEAAGPDPADDVESDLWSQVQEERSRYWTRTGRVDRDRREREQQVVAARARVDELDQELADLESDAVEVARLVTEAEEIESRLSDSQHKEKSYRDRAEAINGEEEAVRRLEAERKTAAAQHELNVEAASRRQELVDRLARSQQEVDEATSELRRADPDRQAAEQRLAEVRGELADARTALEAAEAAHELATADERFRDDEIQLELLTERLGRITAAETVLSDADEALASARVDDELLDQIEAAHIEVVKARAAAESGAATVVAAALDDIELRVGGADFELKPGETEEIAVTDKVEIEVADRVRLTVAAGAESRDLAERLTRAEATLTKLCDRAEVDDLDGARSVNRVRSSAERDRVLSLETIEENRRDLTVEIIERKIAGLGERVGAYPESRSGDSTLPVDFEGAKAQLAIRKRELDGARQVVEALDKSVTEAVDADKEAAQSFATLTEQLRQAEKVHTAATAELAAARDDCPDTELDRELGDAKARLDEIDQALETARSRLDALDPASVATLLDNEIETRKRGAEELRRKPRPDVHAADPLEAQGRGRPRSRPRQGQDLPRSPPSGT